MAQLVDIRSWTRWLTSRGGRDRWRRWCEGHPDLSPWWLPELAAPPGTASTDALQRSLVSLTQDGEGDAARTLLVQLRPGLLRVAVAHRAHPAHRGLALSDAIDETRAAFFETLCRHRLDRRPNRIAANLVLDTRQRLHRAANAELRLVPTADEDLDGPRSLASPPPPTDHSIDQISAHQALGAAAARLPGSPRSREVTVAAAYRAWLLDQPHVVVADELGLAAPAVTSRLHRFRRSLRQEWGEGVDDAA